jgi:Mrp family chromosome partitioning ATPase
MRNLLEALRGEADVIIMDSPPALMLTDATLLAALADGTMVVAQVGRTRSAALRQAVDGLSRATDSLLGAVLNKAGQRGASAYHHYYHAKDTAPKRKRSRSRARVTTPKPVGAEERVA